MKVKLQLLLFAILLITTVMHAKNQSSDFAGAGPLAIGAYYTSQAMCKMKKNKIYKDGICYNKSTYARDYCNNQKNKVFQNGKCYTIKNGKIGPEKVQQSVAVQTDQVSSSTTAPKTITQSLEGDFQPAYLQSLNLWS